MYCLTTHANLRGHGFLGAGTMPLDVLMLQSAFALVVIMQFANLRGQGFLGAGMMFSDVLVFYSK